MKKITVEGIEINFNDLTEEKQKEIYEKNKKKYKQDASKSKYYSIRLAVVKNETDSSELLNIMMRDEMEKYGNNKDLVGSIFNNKIFKIEEETMKNLATSSDWRYRQKVAKASRDSKLLNEMLRNEVNGDDDYDVENTIFENEIFEIEEETIKVLATAESWRNRAKAAELSKDSKLLNEMLRNEVNGDDDYDVENTIFENEIFEIEEETIKVLATSDGWEYRQKAAELSKDVNILLEMFTSELKSDNRDGAVLEAIIENDLFEKEALLEYIQNNY